MNVTSSRSRHQKVSQSTIQKNHELLTQKELSEKINQLMLNVANLSKHELYLFITKNPSALSCYATKTPSKWLLFSQSMQTKFRTGCKTSRLLRKLNDFVKAYDLINCNPTKLPATFNQIFPKEIRELIAFNIPSEFEDNSSTLEKVKLLLLDATPNHEPFTKIMGIPISLLTPWIDQFQVPLHTLKINDSAVKRLLPNLKHVNVIGYPEQTITQMLGTLKEVQHLTCNHLDNIHITNSLENLTSLDLAHSENMTDEDLEKLLSMTKLIHLNLSNCNNISTDGINLLRHLPLESLDLSDCSWVTDETIIEILSFKNLKSLKIKGCNEVTNAGIENLLILSNLTELDLSDCSQITAQGLKLQNVLNHLIALNLSYCNLTDDDLKIISKFSNLKILKLIGCTEITEMGIEDLKLHLKLERLELEEKNPAFELAGRKSLSQL